MAQYRPLERQSFCFSSSGQNKHCFDLILKLKSILVPKIGMYVRRPSIYSKLKSNNVENHRSISAFPPYLVLGAAISTFNMIVPPCKYSSLKASEALFLMKNDGMLMEWPEPSSDIINASEFSSRSSPIKATFAPTFSTFLTFVTNVQSPLSSRIMGNSIATLS